MVNFWDKLAPIVVNFYKAARLEPPPLFKLLGFRLRKYLQYFYILRNELSDISHRSLRLSYQSKNI